ncbi:MAG: TenA family protein [Acidimicrobiales bacterium]
MTNSPRTLEGFSASRQLRQRGKVEWLRATSHPMIREMGAGTLPHETFRFYFEQNIIYLHEYARSIARTISHVSDLEGISVLSRFLVQIVDVEIPANYHFFSRLGGSLDALGHVDASTTTRSYTSFLKEITARDSPAQSLAALLPCQWSYGEIATGLMISAPEDPIYADWIEMFAAPGYDVLVQASNQLLDRCAHDEGAPIDTLSEIFDRSISFEAAFWQMAYTRDRETLDQSSTHHSSHQPKGDTNAK